MVKCCPHVAPPGSAVPADWPVAPERASSSSGVVELVLLTGGDLRGHAHCTSARMHDGSLPHCACRVN